MRLSDGWYDNGALWLENNQKILVGILCHAC